MHDPKLAYSESRRSKRDPNGAISTFGKNDVIVPGTSRLSFKVNLSSTGAGEAQTPTELSRTISGERSLENSRSSSKVRSSVFTLDDADVFMCYQDLWKTTKDRKNAAYQGIQTEAVRKIRIDAGDKGTAVKDVAIGNAFGNMFCIPLDFEMLSSHNPFFQYEVKDRLSYELTFNSHGSVVVSTDTYASYSISEIHLEFDVVSSPELAMMIRNKYKGRSVFMYDRNIRHSKMAPEQVGHHLEHRPCTKSQKHERHTNSVRGSGSGWRWCKLRQRHREIL